MNNNLQFHIHWMCAHKDNTSTIGDIIKSYNWEEDSVCFLCVWFFNLQPRNDLTVWIS